jgi:hypothetical protein
MACQRPPRLVGIPRSPRALVIAVAVVTPSSRIAAMTGARRQFGMLPWLDAFRSLSAVPTRRSSDSQDDNRPSRCTKSARAIT